jgi:hypothetical protein
MSLTWGSIKQLVRMQAVAEQFAMMAKGGEESGAWRDVEWGLGGVLESLVNEVHGTLQNADPALAEEFERVVIGTPAAGLSFTARVAILTGWLKGAVEGETLEVRIRVGDDRARGRKIASSASVGG